MDQKIQPLQNGYMLPEYVAEHVDDLAGRLCEILGDLDLTLEVGAPLHLPSLRRKVERALDHAVSLYNVIEGRQ